MGALPNATINSSTASSDRPLHLDDMILPPGRHGYVRVLFVLNKDFLDQLTTDGRGDRANNAEPRIVGSLRSDWHVILPPLTREVKHSAAWRKKELARGFRPK